MKKTILLTASLLLFITIGYSQFGKLDPSFGINGIVRADLGATYDYGFGLQEILVQPNGNMYLIFERQGQTLFTKRFENGLRDTSFGLNGFSAAVDMIFEHAVMQPDGKIVIAGWTNFGDRTDFYVVRFNTDGSLDQSFSTDGKQLTRFPENSYATAVAIQGDGKIVVAGYTATVYESGESFTDFALARYNTDGTPDKSFSDDGMQVSSVSYGADIPASIAIQSDGKIVVAGHSEANGRDIQYSSSVIARFNTDGSLDSSFAVGEERFGFLSASAHSISLQSDGKIVIAGQTVAGTGEEGEITTTDIFVARYNTDGRLDSTFNNTGFQTTDFGSDDNDNAAKVKLQSDGKILVLGNKWNGSNSDFVLARFNTNGSPDESFATNGVQTTDFYNSEDTARALSIGSDGKIVVTGSSNATEFSLAHYNTDGSPDTAFDEDGKFSNSFKATEQGRTNFTSTAIQKSDGKMIVAGNTWNGNNQEFLVARYNTNGSLDTTFSHDGVQTINFGISRDGARQVAIQKDGKIVAAGYSTDQNDTHFALTRLNKDGTPDSSFGGDGIARLKQTELGSINGLAIQSDGKIVVTGPLWNGSNNDFGIVRYNTNGYLDSTFGTNGIVKTDFGSTEDDAKAIVIQADGKIAVAGLSRELSNTTFLIVRYNTDGSIDTAYKTVAPVGEHDLVNAMTIQSDGKIVIGGSLHSQGEYDSDNYNELNSNYAIARFNTNGTLDTTFNRTGVTIIDVEKDDVINSIVIQRNGKIIAGGLSNNTISLVRFNPNGTLDSSFNGSGIQLTHASTSLNAIRGMAIFTDKLYAAGYGLFPGNFGLALRYEVDDTLLTPVVSITAPGKDTIYSGSARIKLKAAATDEDGYITKVQFYNGTTKLHTETVFPYGFLWIDVPVGNYTITAKATDNNGLVATSAAVKVSVVANKPPTVVIANPVNNETFVGPTTIHLIAAANDPEGTISKVEFYNGNVLLRTEKHYPYTYTWKDVPVGNYKITAKAINNFGLITTSSVTNISVVPNRAPTVSITNLANNQRFTAPATIPLVASAKDPDGTISKVEFYNGDSLLTTEKHDPYTYTWQDVPAGTYTITAKAIDNLGLSKTSAPIKIIVAATDTPIVSGRKPAVNVLSGVNGDISLKVWPNPAGDIININTKGLLQDKQMSISVISAAGVVMKIIRSNSSTQIVSLNVSSLLSGVYTIKVTCEDKIMFRQFIKL